MRPAGCLSRRTDIDLVAGSDPLARMGVRRYSLVPAVILSGLLVRAVEVATAVNRGRCGELDSPHIWALAHDLDRDLIRARGYALAGSLQLGTAVSRGRVSALICGRTQA